MTELHFINDVFKTVTDDRYVSDNNVITKVSEIFHVILIHKNDEKNLISLKQFINSAFKKNQSYYHIWLSLNVIEDWKIILHFQIVLKQEHLKNKMLIVWIERDIIEDYRITVEKLSVNVQSSLTIRYLTNVKKTIMSNTLHKVTIKIQRICKIVTECLTFTDDTENQIIQIILLKLWRIFIFTDLKMYIHCVKDLDIYMKDFLYHIDCKRSWDSCDTWHLNHSDKYFIQFSQTAAAEMQSVIQLKSQNAFSDIENYIIIIRYAVIAEHKLAMNWVKSIKKTSFQL